MFGLDLQSQERRFNVVGTINYKDDYSRMTLVNGPNVLLVDSTGFILWNYVDSRASCWRSPLPPGGADLRVISVSFIIVIVSYFICRVLLSTNLMSSQLLATESKLGTYRN